jgi:hypothetical protein
VGGGKPEPGRDAAICQIKMKTARTLRGGSTTPATFSILVFNALGFTDGAGTKTGSANFCATANKSFLAIGLVIKD